MEFLKSLFTKPLSYDEFVAAATGAGIKLADLSGGEYVAKGKLTEMTDKNKALAEKVSSYEQTIGFSIHAPQSGVRLRLLLLLRVAWPHFNPRTPGRGATRRRGCPPRPSTYFNPRTPGRGATLMSCTSTAVPA